MIMVIFFLTSCENNVDFKKNQDYFEKENDLLLYKGNPYTGQIFEKYTYSGPLKYEYSFKNGKQDGDQFAYEEDGSLRWKGNCKDGKKHGEQVLYYNGYIYEINNFKDGVLEGDQTKFYDNGEIREKINIKNGKKLYLKKEEYNNQND